MEITPFSRSLQTEERCPPGANAGSRPLTLLSISGAEAAAAQKGQPAGGESVPSPSCPSLEPELLQLQRRVSLQVVSLVLCQIRLPASGLKSEK